MRVCSLSSDLREEPETAWGCPLSFPRHTSSRDKSENVENGTGGAAPSWGSRLLGCRASLYAVLTSPPARSGLRPEALGRRNLIFPNQRSGSSCFSLGISSTAAALKEGKKGVEKSVRPTMKNRKLSQRSVIELLPP